MNGEGPRYKTNLNNYIHFKPRELGVKIFEEYSADTKEKFGLEQELIVDESGWAKLQMWEFMNIYGNKLRHKDSMHTTVEMEVMVEVYHGQM